MKSQSHLLLRLPIGIDNERDYAQTLRKHLDVLMRLAMNATDISQDLETPQLEAVSFVAGFMVELYEFETKPP
ncbi:MAG: hypothetical protein AAF998_20105 [Bacteroidota bacterium]